MLLGGQRTNMTKITTEERVEELVKKNMENKKEKMEKLTSIQKILILIGTIAAMTAGAATFVHKFFIQPEIERTAQKYARDEAISNRIYFDDKNERLNEDIKDMKKQLDIITEILMKRRR